jgi:hypothetical protein
MNKNQITLYSESGINIFSKNPNDVRVLSDANSEINDGHEIKIFKPSTFSAVNDFFKRNKELFDEDREILGKISDKGK